MAKHKKRRKSKSKLPWCRVTSGGKVVGHHRLKRAANKAKKTGQRVKAC
jgi:hypothetical protein